MLTFQVITLISIINFLLSAWVFTQAFLCECHKSLFGYKIFHTYTIPKLEIMKTLVTLLSIFILYSSNAQTIEGIGQIKIGKSYSQIIQDVGIEEKKIVDAGKEDLDFFDVYRPKKTLLFKYDSANSKKRDYDYEFIKCPEAVKLVIPTYTVADIKVEQIELQFYHDTLYSIDIKSPSMEFLKAFKTKYGDGNLKKEVKTVQCSSAYVKNYDVEEVTFRTTWESNISNVDVTYVLMDYRDSKCQQQYLTYVLISNSKISKQVTSCETDIRDRMKRKEDSELKNKLKDF